MKAEAGTTKEGESQPRQGKSQKPPSSRDDRRAQRQTEIIDTAARLFAERGYNATGITQLCAAVGLGKGALYHYIGSKQQLLTAIHDRVMTDVLSGMNDVLGLNATPTEKLRMLGIELVRNITQYPDHVWVFLHEWRSLTGEHAVAFRNQRRQYEDAVESVLAEGVAAGEFQIENLRLTALAWHNLHNFTYQWYRPEGPQNAFQIANHFFNIFVNGIAAPDGN